MEFGEGALWHLVQKAIVEAGRRERAVIDPAKNVPLVTNVL